MESTKHTGLAIALAWPQTYCKQPGSWYDPINLLLKINKNHYYKVGHAAVVLIEKNSKKCHYFDFGRYHTPFQHARVRSAETDHDLVMKTKPQVSEDGKTLLNFRRILVELQNNPACHGQGDLHASYCTIDFGAAYNKAVEMQQASPLPYGPFRKNGSNCSRFVNTVLLAGKPGRKFHMRLKYFVPLTPTPIHNVNSLPHKLVAPKLLPGEMFCPIKKLDSKMLYSTLPQPPLPENVPQNAQWLSGEGVGSWFAYQMQGNLLKVTRYSPLGTIECTGLYENPLAPQAIPDNTYQITYPSNCKEVFLRKNGQVLRFRQAVV